MSHLSGSFRYISRRVIGGEWMISKPCRWSWLLRDSNDFDGHGGVGIERGGDGGAIVGS
jgi:hypothetical protein